jgi:hypothetical protein
VKSQTHQWYLLYSILYIHLKSNSIVWEHLLVYTAWWWLYKPKHVAYCIPLGPINSLYTVNVNEILIVVVLRQKKSNNEVNIFTVTVLHFFQFLCSCYKHSHDIGCNKRKTICSEWTVVAKELQNFEYSLSKVTASHCLYDINTLETVLLYTYIYWFQGCLLFCYRKQTLHKLH